MVFVSVSPEDSSIYNAQNPNGIELFHDPITDKVTRYPKSEIIWEGDLNDCVKDFCDYSMHDDLDFVFGTDIPCSLI